MRNALFFIILIFAGCTAPSNEEDAKQEIIDQESIADDYAVIADEKARAIIKALQDGSTHIVAADDFALAINNLSRKQVFDDTVFTGLK